MKALLTKAGCRTLRRQNPYKKIVDETLHLTPREIANATGINNKPLIIKRGEALPVGVENPGADEFGSVDTGLLRLAIQDSNVLLIHCDLDDFVHAAARRLDSCFFC